MRFILVKYLIIIFLISSGNIFPQNTESDNYEIIKFTDSTGSGFYVKPGYPNPFSPVLDVYFGIYDSSLVKITVFKESTNDTIVKLDTTLISGNYFLSWFKFNMNIADGYYVVTLNCINKKWGLLQEFNSSQKFIVVK